MTQRAETRADQELAAYNQELVRAAAIGPPPALRMPSVDRKSAAENANTPAEYERLIRGLPVEGCS